MAMKRRTFLGTAAATAAAPLAAPAYAQGSKVLKFIPQSDVTVLDPIWTTAYVTRNHGFMIYDTLYGTDGNYQATPQMAAGHVVEDGGKQWTITLRDGLKFHDGEKVLARDCVPSIKRWGARDAFGASLMAVTDAIEAVDDKRIRFRLKKPFPLLAAAIGKSGSNMCPILPERLAKTSPFKQVTDMTGSGPFKWNAKERVTGSRAVYEKNTDYVPLASGTPSGTSGPKVVHYDRVEWHVIPDVATKTGAMQSGELDWWENPPADNAQVLALDKKLVVRILDPSGLCGCMRMNQLNPPFDNPAVRRVLLDAVYQKEYVVAIAGTDPKLWHVPCGYFTPGTPMASTEGLKRFTEEKDYKKLQAQLKEAGYKGEKVVLMMPTDFPELKAEAEVGLDILKKCGFNVDGQAMDWGSVVQRRASQKPIADGGWSVFHTFWTGLDWLNPAVNAYLRGQGKAGGQPGWPSSPKIEELHDQWLAAADEKEQKELAVKLQEQALIDVPYVPVGQYFQNTAYKKDITGILDGFVIFWNVRPA